MIKFKVHIVDSSRLFREGLKRLFVSSPFFVSGESISVNELSKYKNENLSDTNFLIIGCNYIDTNLLSYIGQLLKITPMIKIIIVFDEINYNIITDALQCGVQGILLKDKSPEAFLQSLLLVGMGEKVFPSDLARLLINSDLDQRIPRTHKPSVGNNLSRRERQILDGLVQGQSNKAIARALNVAEGTVKVHLKSLLRKIKARNRTQAAIWGHSIGLASPRPKAQPGSKRLQPGPADLA